MLLTITNFDRGIYYFKWLRIQDPSWKTNDSVCRLSNFQSCLLPPKSVQNITLFWRLSITTQKCYLYSMVICCMKLTCIENIYCMYFHQNSCLVSRFLSAWVQQKQQKREKNKVHNWPTLFGILIFKKIEFSIFGK